MQSKNIYFEKNYYLFEAKYLYNVEICETGLNFYHLEVTFSVISSIEIAN